MSLILRRNVKPSRDGTPRDGVVIDGGRITVRLIKVDSDGTVHLAFQAPSSVQILREELLNHTPGQDYPEPKGLPGDSEGPL